MRTPRRCRTSARRKLFCDVPDSHGPAALADKPPDGFYEAGWGEYVMISPVHTGGGEEAERAAAKGSGQEGPW